MCRACHILEKQAVAVFRHLQQELPVQRPEKKACCSGRSYEEQHLIWQMSLVAFLGNVINTADVAHKANITLQCEDLYGYQVTKLHAAQH